MNSLLGALLAAGIRQWVRITGQSTSLEASPWLKSPLGSSGKIGAQFYDALTQSEDLTLRNSSAAGLLTDFSALRGPDFDPDKVDPRIHDFYEHTGLYQFDVWSEANLWTRVFLWLLTRFISQDMDQLNFPVSSLELAHGMSSQVLPLHDATGTRVYTGWLRRLKKTGRVIYTGLYSVAQPPHASGPCVKVSFPLPFGSSTVFLRPEAAAEGSFRLISSGQRFGEAGFYRMVGSGEASQDQWRVRYIRTLRELFYLYIDADGVLRTDHTVKFLGLVILRLHYKMQRTPELNIPSKLSNRPIGSDTWPWALRSCVKQPE
jgi:hypothetical protein